MRLYGKRGTFLGHIQTPPREILERGQFEFEVCDIHSDQSYTRYQALVREIRFPRDQRGIDKVYVAQMIGEFRHLAALDDRQGTPTSFDAECDRVMQNLEG